MVDTPYQPACGSMEIACKRNATTLLPITHTQETAGSIVHSDQWSAYNQVSILPNVAAHDMVNHSVTFVDPSTGTHTTC